MRSQPLFTSADTPADTLALQAPGDLSFEEKVERTLRSITRQLAAGKALLVACSFGKDSSVLLNLTLQAAARFQEERGRCPDIIVVHSDTLLENPVMSLYARGEIQKAKAFAARHGLPVRVDVVSPNLSGNYLVNIIGGRSLLVTGAQDSKCSQDLKVTPIRKHKRRLFKGRGLDSVVTLVGTRFDESRERGRAMRARGDNPDSPIRNSQNEWLLSPIADFTTDDVFRYLGQVRAGRLSCYSDFDDLVEVYRDANGGTCDAIVFMTGGPGKTGCGARTGCWICARVNDDKSMANMLQDERYSFMAPLYRFRQYLLDTFYDPARRNWLSRSVSDDGNMRLSPNTYSPAFCEELLRIALTIDAEEQNAAAALGIEPRFQLLSERDLIMVELLWARYGYHDTAKAMQIYNEVCHGARYPVPELNRPFTRKDLKLVEMTVPFMEPQDEQNPFAGLRDIEAAMAGIEGTVTKNGKSYTDVRTDVELSIEEEAAELFFDFEFEHFLERFSGGSWAPHQVVHYFLRLGTVSLNLGGHSEWDRMLRIAHRIHQLDLRPLLNDPLALLERLRRHSRENAHTDNVPVVEQFGQFAMF